MSHENPKGRPVQSRQKKEPRATKKRTHRSGPGWREQKKQLKCARRDSNPGRGRSRGRPFFARPKPHHPTMRLGEVEHSKVSYLCQSPGENGILAPLSRVWHQWARRRQVGCITALQKPACCVALKRHFRHFLSFYRTVKLL